jgi:hypothetical protein
MFALKCLSELYVYMYTFKTFLCITFEQPVAMDVDRTFENYTFLHCGMLQHVFYYYYYDYYNYYYYDYYY